MKSTEHLHMASLLARGTLGLALEEIEREVTGSRSPERLAKLARLARLANDVLELPARRPVARGKPQRTVRMDETLPADLGPVLAKLEAADGTYLPAASLGLSKDQCRRAMIKLRNMGYKIKGMRGRGNGYRLLK